jgi:hypothetical protein
MRAAVMWASVDIRRRWTSLCMLAAFVALAVGPVLALTAGARRADGALDRYLTAADVPEVLISSQAGPSRDALAALEADPRIASVERAEGVMMTPAPLEPGTEGFTVIGLGDSLTGGFGRPLLLSGRFPESGAIDEIALSEGVASRHGLRVGQRVPLIALGCLAGCPPEKVGDATIVGVVRLPTDIAGDPSVPGVVIAEPGVLDGGWRSLARLPTWLGVHLNDASDTRSVIADWSTKFVDGEVASSRVSLTMPERAGDRQRNGLLVAAALLAGAGALLVTQVVARHLAGRWSDCSVLAALGVSARERAAAGGMAVAPALVAGVIGGGLLAIAMSPLFPLGISRHADPDIGFHVDAMTMLVGGAGAVLMLTALAALCAQRWARPARVVATQGEPSLAARFAQGLGVRPVAATGIRFALERGVGMRRLPVLATTGAAIAATSLVIGGLVVRWSFDELVATPARYGQAWDLIVEVAPADLHREARRLAGDPRVGDVAIARTGEVNLGVGEQRATTQIPTTGIESLTGALPVAVLEGRAPAGPREIALSMSVATTLDLDLGDRATASGPCGTFGIEVVGRIIVPITAGNYPDDGSLVTLDAFEELCAHDLLADADAGNTALVRVRDPGAADDLRDEWHVAGLRVIDRAIPTSITAVGDVRSVPLVVVALAALLGACSVANALSLAVRRRGGDISVLRALGLRPRQAGTILQWQAAAIALAGVVVGLPLGLVLGATVWSAIAQPSNVVVHVDVRLLGVAAVASTALVVAVLMSVWASHRAAQLRPAAGLTSE